MQHHKYKCNRIKINAYDIILEYETLKIAAVCENEGSEKK